MPDINDKVEAEEKEDVTEVQEQEEDTKISEENLLSETTEKNMVALMKQVKDVVGVLESVWHATEAEFKLKDHHMKELMAYNSNHLVKPAEDATPEEKENWDPSNGLDSLTEEKVTEIFGEDHPIIGITHDVTLSRIKDAYKDFYAWFKSLREYGDIQDAYMDMLEEKENLAVEELKECMEAEEDPQKKDQMRKAIDLYYSHKHLDFLKLPLDKETIDRIVKNYKSEGKVSYWIQRTRDKLKQMKISQKFILEISHFETRFLEEKYHVCDNILLMYFMSLIVYTDVHNKKNDTRNEAACMVFMLDRFIRNKLDEDLRKIILDNVIALEDQFLGKI